MSEKVFNILGQKEVFTGSELKSMMLGVDNNGMVVLNVDNTGKPTPIVIEQNEDIVIQDGNAISAEVKDVQDEVSDSTVEEVSGTEETKQDSVVDNTGTNGSVLTTNEDPVVVVEEEAIEPISSEDASDKTDEVVEEGTESTTV